MVLRGLFFFLFERLYYYFEGGSLDLESASEGRQEAPGGGLGLRAAETFSGCLGRRREAGWAGGQDAGVLRGEEGRTPLSPGHGPTRRLPAQREKKILRRHAGTRAKRK